MTKAECNDFIRDVNANGSKLPIIDITLYSPNAKIWCLQVAHFPVYSFASTTDVIFMNIWHLFSERRPQFASPNGFYSVYDQMYSQCAVCGYHWFLFCLLPYLFSEWHIVPLLCIQIKQSRVHSRKALYECKASRRLGKQMRCFYRFLSKAQPIVPYIAFPKKRHSVLLFTVAKFAKFNYLI